MKSKVIGFYMTLFKSFEKNGMCIDDDWHIFVLHYLFMPRIEQELDQFKRTWNNHQVSTEKNKTPLQMLEMRSDSFPVEVDNEYEVDEYDQDDISDDGEDYSVACDPTCCPLSDHNLSVFQSRVKPIELSTPESDLANWFYTTIEYVLEIKRDQLNN